MQILPIDVTALVASVLGISIVLVPVIGITARFALKPTVEALSRLFEKRALDESLSLLERRLDLQEQELDALRNAVRSLTATREFDRQLAAGKPATPERAVLASEGERSADAPSGGEPGR